MKVTIIGPNLRDQSKGTFHVHAAGCADIAKMAKRDPAYRDGWNVDVDSCESVVLDVYGPDAGSFDLDPDNREDIDQYMSEFHFAPCTTDLPTYKEDITMSTKTARKIRKPATKPAAKKATIVKEATAVKTTQKSKTVTLKLDKSKTKGKAKFNSDNPTLLSAVYLTREFFALLKKQKTADLTFTPADKQPKHSFRFNEVGDEQGIGSLYVLKDGASKVAKLDAKATVKVRVQRDGDDIKLTVSAS